MEETRLVKNVVFGIVEGTSRRGRPNRESRRMDDIKEWCQEDIHILSRKAKKIVISGDRQSSKQ